MESTPCGHHGDVKRECRCPPREIEIYRQRNSCRTHDRILKVARTLADLAGATDIRPNDILEVIQYRSLDGKLFS